MEAGIRAEPLASCFSSASGPPHQDFRRALQHSARRAPGLCSSVHRTAASSGIRAYPAAAPQRRPPDCSGLLQPSRDWLIRRGTVARSVAGVLMTDLLRHCAATPDQCIAMTGKVLDYIVIGAARWPHACRKNTARGFFCWGRAGGIALRCSACQRARKRRSGTPPTLGVAGRSPMQRGAARPSVGARPDLGHPEKTPPLQPMPLAARRPPQEAANSPGRRAALEFRV